MSEHGISNDVDWTRTGREVIGAQPFSELLGATLETLSRDGVELRLTLTPALNQHRGRVHGGVIGYLADNAIAFAAGPHLGPDIVTSDYALNFCRPPTGSVLVARARVVTSGRTKAVVHCEVSSAEGGEERVCALAIGTVLVTDRSSPRVLAGGVAS